MGKRPGWVHRGATHAFNFAEDDYFNCDVTRAQNFSTAEKGFIDGSTTPANRYTPSKGGVLVPSTANSNRLTKWGLWAEGTTKNNLLYGSDLTQSAWTKDPTTIVALDQVGPDGKTNSASSVAATAANTTFSQSITLASAICTTSVYMKRLVGTGSFFLSQDNGATPVDIAPYLLLGNQDNNGFVRVRTIAQTLTNPTIIGSIGTAGDKFAWALGQNEPLSYPSSAILTLGTAVSITSNEEPVVGTITSHWNEGARLFNECIQSGGPWSAIITASGSPRNQGYIIVGINSNLNAYGGCDGGAFTPYLANSTPNNGIQGLFNMNKFAIRCNGKGIDGCMNGGPITVKNTSGKQMDPAFGNEHCGFGNNGSGTNPGPLDGFFPEAQFFAFYDMSDDEMIDLTAL